MTEININLSRSGRQHDIGYGQVAARTGDDGEGGSSLSGISVRVVILLSLIDMLMVDVLTV